MSKNITKFKENKTIGSQLITYQNRRLNKIIDNLMSELEDAIATGECITVNDSANALASIEFEGNTKQTQYTGKNFFNVANSSAYWQTLGFRLIDNIIKINIGDGNGGLSQGAQGEYTNYDFDTNKSYYFSVEPKSGDLLFKENAQYKWLQVTIYIKYSDDTTSTKHVRITHGMNMASVLVTFTADKTPVAYAIGRYSPVGSLQNNQEAEYYVQLEEGTEATDYEPYVGGQPSPNPEYPQDIQVVKGNNEVKIENKNLFVANWVKAYLTGSGTLYYTAAGHNSLGTVNYIKVKPNTQYRLSSVLGPLVTRITNLFVSEYDKDYKHIQRKSHATTFTTGANTEYIRISWYQFSNSGTDVETDKDNPDLYVKNVQLELGGTATNYIEHKEQTYSITLPEGMFLAKTQNYADKFEGSIDNWYIPNKILKIDSYNGETIETEYISTTGGLDIGATVYYVGTETLPITDTTLIEQLNALLNVMSYYEQTNITVITVENEGLNPILKFNYKKSNNLRIKALEERNETILSRLDLLEG